MTMSEDGLSAAALLAVWEQGRDQRLGARALTLLAAAQPDLDGPARAAVTIGARDRALIDLRERLFGHRFVGVTRCPACRAEIEVTFDAGEVRRPPLAVDAGTVSAGGYDIEFRLPNAADAAAIERTRDLTEARRLVFERCVRSARQHDLPVGAADLPEDVVGAAIAKMAELDPQADVPLDLDCPECGHAWQEPFDVVTYLWQELAGRARRLVEEVHTIASAYGWSESEILRLSPARREAYLELLQ